jgi:hypothetical protein
MRWRPMATSRISGSAETPSSEAAARPIGIITSAIGVLEMNCEMVADTTKIPTSTACGPRFPAR